MARHACTTEPELGLPAAGQPMHAGVASQQAEPCSPRPCQRCCPWSFFTACPAPRGRTPPITVIVSWVTVLGYGPGSRSWVTVLGHGPGSRSCVPVLHESVTAPHVCPVRRPETSDSSSPGVQSKWCPAPGRRLSESGPPFHQRRPAARCAPAPPPSFPSLTHAPSPLLCHNVPPCTAASAPACRLHSRRLFLRRSRHVLGAM